MQGSVLRSNRDGGTISAPPHGDVEFLWADVSRGLRLRVNQQIEFDIGDDGHGGEKAVNIRAVQQQARVSVSTRFGEPVDAPTCRTIPCTITFERGNNPVIDMAVRLTANGNRQTWPATEPTTDSFGKVFFGVQVHPSETYADVLVEANGKSYTATWRYSTPKPELAIMASEGQGWKNLLITWSEGDKLFPATLEVWPTNGCRIALREAGHTAWKKATGKSEWPTTGRIILQIKVEKAPKGVGGENIFVGVKGLKAQSGPQYVSANL